MNPATALQTGVRFLWERSASVIPVYLLANGLYGIARVPLFLAGALALWLLAVGGRLDPLVDVLREVESGAGPTDPDPTDLESVFPGLSDALTNLLTPETVALVAVGGVLSVALALVVSAIGNAAAISAIVGILRDDDGVCAAVDGARRHWRAFLVVRLLLFATLGVVIVPVVAVVVAVAGYSGPIDPTAAAAGGPPGAATVLGIVAAVLGLLVTLLVVAVIFVLFAFADQAIVVDDVGAFAAIGRSVRFPFRRPIAVLGYVAVAIAALVVSGTVGGAAAAAGTARVSALLGVVVLPPVVDGFKTSLYAETSLPSLPESERTPIGERLRTAFGSGLGALGGFVRSHPAAHLVSLAVLLAGGAVGWTATGTLGVTFPASGDVTGIFGQVPVGPFANIAVNNWLVAIDLTYSGLAAGIPAVVSLAFNGLLVGAVGGVFDPVAFAALVAPHGVVEVPALVVGGALGLHLGGVAVGTARGRHDTDALAAAIRRAYRVLLGLAPVFVLAAFVEAFLTPAIAGVVIGG
ncbi:stage II sporulation protein M [Halobellus ordinarius]|uniref:stage II sporulation protein M n=1 Tax=Halobellus ordinarius TaxID=3075120 RepID=UPI002880B713|nr:stage II sporulation protein M [Halobellus sp. ZY16]